MNFIQKMLAKYLGPKIIAGFIASTIAFVGGWLSGAAPTAPGESIELISNGLYQLLMGVGSLGLAYFIDLKTAKALLNYFKDKKPEQPEIVKED
jgi:hypothetical protein